MHSCNDNIGEKLGRDILTVKVLWNILFRFSSWHSGFEIAEPGFAKGTVLVHYLNWDAEEEEKDTIVKPTFSRIYVDD